MESKICDHESNKGSKKLDVGAEIEVSAIVKESVCEDNSRSSDDCAEKATNGECVVIDIGNGDIGKPKPKLSNEDSDEERVCRICHFGPEESSSELFELGCDCRGELGSSHRHCAEAWFSIKGNRLCEICGTIAKSISIMNQIEASSMSTMEWNEVRLVVTTLDPDLERSGRCKHFCLHLLLVCLVLLFVMPWLFRGMNIF